MNPVSLREVPCRIGPDDRTRPGQTVPMLPGRGPARPEQYRPRPRLLIVRSETLDVAEPGVLVHSFHGRRYHDCRSVQGLGAIGLVYRAGGCPHCGGEPFHHLDCPFVRNTLIFSTIALGVTVGVFIAVDGTRSPGPVLIFLLYLALLVGWLIASRRQRGGRN